MFWMIGPTMITRQRFDSLIHERVDSMWKVHENRLKRGLDGTVQQSGIYDVNHHKQDSNF